MKQSGISKLPDIKRLDRLQQAFDHCHPSISKRQLSREAFYSYEYVIRMFSGERRISDEAIERFAPILKVRKEFLYGTDNIMTEKEYRMRMEYADRYAALIDMALFGSRYRFPDKDCDLSEFAGDEQLSPAYICALKHFVREGYHPIIFTGDPYSFQDDAEYDFAILDDDEYLRLVRDIQGLIKVRVQQAYEDNQLSTQEKMLEAFLGK